MAVKTPPSVHTPQRATRGANLANACMPFVAWLPIVHRRYFKGQHMDWLLKDIGVILVLPLTCAVLLLQTKHWPSSQSGLAVELLVVYAGLTALAAGSASSVRTWVRTRARPTIA